jgi:hypothetical protein
MIQNAEIRCDTSVYFSYGCSQSCEELLLASSCPSVRPPANMEQLGSSHWNDFCEIWYVSIYRKSVEKIQVSLKSDNECFT